MYTRGCLILIKTRLRGSVWRLGVWYFGAFSLWLGAHVPIVLNDSGPSQFTCHSKVYFASSHLISSWRRPHISVSSLLCKLSLTWKRCHFNIIGIYVHLVLLPALDTVSSVRPIITDWTSSNGRSTQSSFDLSFAFADRVRHCDIWLTDWQSNI